METGRPVSQIPKVARAPRFSADGKKLAIGGHLGLVKIIHWPNLDQPIEVSVGGGGFAYPLHWSNDGKRLLVYSDGVANLVQIDLSDGGSKVSPSATLAKVYCMRVPSSTAADLRVFWPRREI